MNYHDEIVRDFAYRTLRNLEFVEAEVKKKTAAGEKDANLFELTQLVNSLLGLVIIPKERGVEKIPRIPIKTLWEKGWPQFDVGEQYTNLRNLIEGMRHATAHFQLQFKVDAVDQIESVIMSNKPWRESEHRVATFSIEALSDFAKRFALLINHDYQLDTKND